MPIASRLRPGAVLRQSLSYERLQQVLDSISPKAALSLPFLRCRIASFQPSGKHLLRRHPSLMQGDTPIGTDGILAQLRAGAAGAVENNEHLAAVRRDLHPEAGTLDIPVDEVRCGSR